jgi:hypothetical protein
MHFLSYSVADQNTKRSIFNFFFSSLLQAYSLLLQLQARHLRLNPTYHRQKKRRLNPTLSCLPTLGSRRPLYKAIVSLIYFGETSTINAYREKPKK